MYPPCGTAEGRYAKDALQSLDDHIGPRAGFFGLRGLSSHPERRLIDKGQLRLGQWSAVYENIQQGHAQRCDPLLNLFAKSESDAIALLGSPKKREYAETIDDTYLIWSFPVDGRSADQRPLPQSEQTLTLHFTTGVGCNSITLVW